MAAKPYLVSINGLRAFEDVEDPLAAPSGDLRAPEVIFPRAFTEPTGMSTVLTPKPMSTHLSYHIH